MAERGWTVKPWVYGQPSPRLVGEGVREHRAAPVEARVLSRLTLAEIDLQRGYTDARRREWLSARRAVDRAGGES